jgi:hypothetical protein
MKFMYFDRKVPNSFASESRATSAPFVYRVISPPPRQARNPPGALSPHLLNALGFNCKNGSGIECFDDGLFCFFYMICGLWVGKYLRLKSTNLWMGFREFWPQLYP